MTVAALPGNVRLRAFQIGKETTFGTTVPATRRLPTTFTPNFDLHVTFPTADTGTLDRALAPYRMAADIDGQLVGNIAYNDLPYYLAAALKGGVTPTGSPNVWTYQPAYTSQDVFEIFTAEWGDETGDQYQLSDGVANQIQFTYPEDLGPIQLTEDWFFSAISGGPNTSFTRTPGLQVDPAPNWVYGADTKLYIDSTAGGIEGTTLLNTLHGATVTLSNNLDKKRFSNGSNTRFQLAGYGRGLRTLTAQLTFAKSTVGIAEVANWLNQNPVERFLGLRSESVAIAGGATHYAFDMRFAGFWTANTYGTTTAGGGNPGNTTDVLTCENFIDQTLAYPWLFTVTNTLASL